MHSSAAAPARQPSHWSDCPEGGLDEGPLERVHDPVHATVLNTLCLHTNRPLFLHDCKGLHSQALTQCLLRIA